MVIQPPTLGTSAGAAFILLTSMICFSALNTRVAIHEVLIFIFVTLTTPVTLMLLARAALYRDRTEGSTEVPEFEPSEEPGTRRWGPRRAEKLKRHRYRPRA
jgi:multicomponent K+:H+ antiporter subunit G